MPRPMKRLQALSKELGNFNVSYCRAVECVVVLTCVFMLVNLAGCSTVSYYSQSVIGHSKLMLAREPVANVVDSAAPKLQAQLVLSVQLKQFAAENLALDFPESYTQYVALEREFPVWNVVAAPEFSVQAKQWCYPVIGCASYRGYFKQDAALAYAQKMQNKGYETMVGGAPAYSTLGWFSDPILPSMLRYGDTNFAETLFHELAHQQLYINGDSDFNEAFATVVGEVGTMRWLAAYRPLELHDYREQLRAAQDFNALISELKVRLEQIYASALSEPQMRSAKQAELAAFINRYQQLKAGQWEGKGWYDRWFEKPINNARLAGFSTYYELVPSLLKLLEKCDSDFPHFYQVLSTANRLDGTVIVPDQCSADDEN